MDEQQRIEVPEVFIVSDTHFGHKNIIKYCNRPFESVQAMDEGLILRWNAIVGPRDVVIHLGDVGFNYGQLFDIISRLRGSKMLVRGNHDWGPERMEALGFRCLTRRRNDLYREMHAGRIIYLAHRPRDLPTWDEEELHSHLRPVRLCGHEHNNAPVFIKWVRDKQDKARPVMALNMSCEHWNYSPVLLSNVIEIYDKYIDKLK